MTIQADTYAGFELVAGLRREVTALVRRQINVIASATGEAQQERWLDRLGELANMVEADTFKVIMLGQFSRGKSTVVNALLGQKVLPSYATETTAVINAVKFGQHPQAVLYPRPTPDDTHPKPVEIDISQLEAYIRVDDGDEQAGRLNPYIRADVYWPIELCRNGVELIDSPGLDAVNEAREEETIAYLTSVDAVVMVLDAQQAATRSELEFFSDVVQPLGHEDVFWVVNKINLVGDDREKVVQRTNKVLAPYTRHENRIHYVDARGAIEAKEAHDSGGLAESGLPELEENLQQFLTLHRGRAKVLVPVRQVQQSIREVRDAIHTGEQFLGETLENLVARAHAAERPLGGMDKTARYLSEDLERQFAEVVEQVGRATERHMTELIEGCPKLMASVKTESKLSLNPRLIKSSAQKFADELAHGLRGAVQQDLLTWRAGDLASMVNDRLTAIQHEIRDDIRDFEESLKGVRLNLALAASAQVDALDITITPTIVAESGSGAKGDLVRFGAGKALGTAFAGGAGAFAGFIAVSVLGLSAFAPIIIAAGALWFAVAAAKDSNPQQTLEDKIRKRLLAGTVKHLDENRAAIVEQTQADARDHLHRIAQEFRSVLTSKVQSLREELNAALAAKNEGEQEVRARREHINCQLVELDSINQSLDSIVDRVVALDEDLTHIYDASPDDATSIDHAAGRLSKP